MYNNISQKTLIIGRSISERLTSCYFFGLCCFGQIQTSQTGGWPYSDTSPYGECFLHKLINISQFDQESRAVRQNLTRRISACSCSLTLMRNLSGSFGMAAIFASSWLINCWASVMAIFWNKYLLIFLLLLNELKTCPIFQPTLLILAND